MIPRFNGAARSRARKFPSAKLVTACATWLQWGRALSRAEIWRDGQKGVGLSLASMGPRALARGNPFTTTLASREQRLQWGRALSRAEMLTAMITLAVTK